MAQGSNNLLIFILAVGVFGILNTEMGVVGIIPQVSEAFSVSVPDAGMLVSGFALIVAIAGPTMPLLFSKANRKTVMLLALGVFTVCNAAAIFAPTFELLLAARVIPAAFHPLYVSMAMAVASQTGATPADRAKSSSRVFAGVSAGMVIGPPLASFLASAVVLEAVFALFAAVTAAVFVATIFLVPSMPVERALSYGGQVAILKKPVVWASLLATVLVNGGMFGFYSFMSDYFGAVSGMGALAVSAVLLLYGGANIVGNIVSGHALGRAEVRTLITMPIVLVALYAVLFAVGELSVATAAVVTVLGVIAGIANNANQYMVSRAAPEAPDFSNGLYLTAANIGTTAGTALCGALITAAGTRASVAGAVIFVAVGVTFVAWRIICTRKAVDKQADDAVARVTDNPLGSLPHRHTT